MGPLPGMQTGSGANGQPHPTLCGSIRQPDIGQPQGLPLRKKDYYLVGAGLATGGSPCGTPARNANKRGTAAQSHR